MWRTWSWGFHLNKLLFTNVFCQRLQMDLSELKCICQNSSVTFAPELWLYDSEFCVRAVRASAATSTRTFSFLSQILTKVTSREKASGLDFWTAPSAGDALLWFFIHIRLFSKRRWSWFEFVFPSVTVYSSTFTSDWFMTHKCLTFIKKERGAGNGNKAVSLEFFWIIVRHRFNTRTAPPDGHREVINEVFSQKHICLKLKEFRAFHWRQLLTQTFSSFHKSLVSETKVKSLRDKCKHSFSFLSSAFRIMWSVWISSLSISDLQL